jgi:GYF domain 2
MNPDEVHWYYIDDQNHDAQVGPFVLKDFKEKFLAGVFTPESYCWHEEIDDWDKLKNIYFRSKPALNYFNESFLLMTNTDSYKPLVAESSLNSGNPEPKSMSIEDEIKERLRKKFAK